MKVLAVLCICVLAADAVVGAISKEAERLIDAIVASDYDSAVQQALLLDQRSEGDKVKDAINRLVTDSKTNLLDFAYKLWIGDGKSIVKWFFPTPFSQLFLENNVKLTYVRDNLAIKLGAATDENKDRIAYGDADDKTTKNVAWKLVPLWEDNRVFFKIQNVPRHQYLKLGTDTDSANERVAYGSDGADTHRHNWYLKPVEYDGNVLFFIYNRQYNQALKLGRAVDSAGDRQVYSHAQAVDGKPELFGWSIRTLN